MASFDITAPNGQKYRINAPEGATQDQALQYFRSQHPEMDSGGSGDGGGEKQQQNTGGSFREGAEDFLHGLNTGIAGDIVGAGQLARHVLPNWMTDPIANSQVGQRLSQAAQPPANQSWTNWGGSMVGAGLPFLAVPGLGSTWGPAARVMTRSTLPAAVQPVNPNDPDYWSTKALQTGVGTVAGEALQGLGSLGARALANIKNTQFAKSLRDLVLQINQQISDENAGRRAKFETDTDRTKAINQRIAKRNEGITERFQQARDTREQLIENQKQAVQTAKQAQAAVPAQTTQNWWREALAVIGEQGRTPRNSQTASAQVRRIIGDRLNNVREQMLLNPYDQGFQGDIEQIRGRLDRQLTNQKIRDDWAYEAPTRFDAQGNQLPPSRTDLARQQGSIWGKYVTQPIQDQRYIHGRPFAEYISRISDLAEEYARKAMRAPESEAPEFRMISQGLRDVIDVVESHGTGGDPALTKQLGDAKRAYHLWSIGNDSVDLSGEMTPGKLIGTWMRRQGGQANYGAEMVPGHPQFHPENARIKQGLERALQAHTGPLPAATPPPPVPRPTTKWGQIPPPPKPKMVQPGPPPSMVGTATPSTGMHTLGKVGRRLLAAHVGGLPGLILEPLATAGARRVARSPTAASILSKAQHLGTPIAAASSKQVTPGTDEIPEITVRPKPGDR